MKNEIYNIYIILKIKDLRHFKCGETVFVIPIYKRTNYVSLKYQISIL